MRILIAVLALTMVAPAIADNYTRGYVRKDGTYVAPHYQTAPNNTRFDNYSTQGNVNPYTGQRGYENPTPGSRYGAPAVRPYTNPYGTGTTQRRSRSSW